MRLFRSLPVVTLISTSLQGLFGKWRLSGADLIELGTASDPAAEGPVIQAPASGLFRWSYHKIFDMVRDLRREVKVPMVFMTYANLVYIWYRKVSKDSSRNRDGRPDSA